jgi:hypothetical protein
MLLGVSDADRIVRARQEKAQIESSAIEEREAAGRASRFEDQRETLLELLPAAIDALGQRKWDGAVLLQVPRWVLKGGYRGPRKERAAYLLASTFTDREDNHHYFEYYLLSNGHFATMSGSPSFDRSRSVRPHDALTIADGSLSLVIQGLRNVIDGKPAPRESH